ncbi:MAG: ATP-binding cassette domain-containing protein [Enterobacterales bacterium]|nr:ATP-binding cassette domain-containing protein [Enterobacterales bacterium]
MHQAALVVNNLNQSIAQDIKICVPRLTINSGRRVALLGLNGAGKTSLIKLLIGEFQSPNSCIQYPQFEALKHSLSNTDLAFKQRLGYQSDTMLSLLDLTGDEYLKLCASLKQIDDKQLLEAMSLIEQNWQIQHLLHKKMRHLSKGNLQKLAIAQVFINQPDYLFFDEPCQSLDPLEQENFNQLLRSIEDFELCFFSTHNVDHALAVANDIILFHQFKMVFHFSLSSASETESQAEKYLLVTTLAVGQISELEQEFKLSIRVIEQQVLSIDGLTQKTLDKFLEAIKKQCPVKLFKPHKQCILPFFRMIASGELNLTRDGSKGISINAAS